jgi:cell division protein FtsL
VARALNQKTLNVDNLKEFNSAKQNDRAYKIIIILLLVILVGLGYLYIVQQQKTEQKIAELNQVSNEKEALTFQYQSLLDDYDGLETTNDSISAQLSTEKERIKELMSELRSTKVQNRNEIDKYKKELKTLRDIMKGFIHQIDSLNTLNIQLTEENVQIKKQYKTAKDENRELTVKIEEATDKVAKASVIKAIGVNMESYNQKGKLTNRARKAKRFAVNFSLDENVIAPQGMKNVYVRITDPKEHILIEHNTPVFSYEGEEIAYSAVRQIEYNGTLTPATVYFEVSEEGVLEEGEYTVDIFCDGSMIGTGKAVLK